MTIMQEVAARLVEDVRAGLGGNLIGAAVFGSVARGSDTPDSDIDLLFVVAEPGAQAAGAYVRSVTSGAVAPLRVAASTESYPRLKYFAERGDPFIRAIFVEGTILLDSSELLRRLRNLCLDPGSVPNSAATVQYLREKGQYHHQLVEQHLYELICNLQLSMMARAQALFVANSIEINPKRLIDAADWTRLSRHLHETGWTERRVKLFEALVKAHKYNGAEGPIATLKTAMAEITESLEDIFYAATSPPSTENLSHRQSSPNPAPAPDC